MYVILDQYRDSTATAAPIFTQNHVSRWEDVVALNLGRKPCFSDCDYVGTMFYKE